MLKVFAVLLVIPFLYSCQNSAVAQEGAPQKELAYAQVTKTKHTNRAKKQQKDIHKRLRKIKEQMEKRRKREGGK